MQEILDRNGSSTGMYHDVEYGGVQIGGSTGWSHEATITLDLPQAIHYCSSSGGGFEPVELAHEYLKSHLVATGKQVALQAHAM
jgi:hypothetical protein